MEKKSVLITGGNGYVGKQIVAALSSHSEVSTVVSADVRALPDDQKLQGVNYVTLDIRKPGLGEVLKQHQITTVVHLASIVTPGKKHNREFEYSVDVEGTRNVLESCVYSKVRHIIVSSSGAAYGYHADNPEWIRESDPLRGNHEIPYSWHKRLVEEMLAEYRVKHPELAQTIFRIGTILGETVSNQITDLFKKPRLIGIRGSKTPFVFIWDQDLIAAFLRAIHLEKAGIYNVAGDGALTLHELAKRLQKPTLMIPSILLRSALWTLRKLHLTQYGPEQVKFIQHRPVLENTRLKTEFGFTPSKNSSEVFEYWMSHNRSP